MPLLTLRELLSNQLRDLYNAESQYRQILPGMLNSAADEDLRVELTNVLEQNELNLGGLRLACRQLDVDPNGLTCEAMRGLVHETRDTLAEYGDPQVIDAALIANAQRIAHYQIAGYGTARQFARVIGADGVADTLDDLATRAGQVDHQLTKVADGGWFTRGVNQHASKAPAPVL